MALDRAFVHILATCTEWDITCRGIRADGRHHVRDRGLGIRAADLPCICDRGYRACVVLADRVAIAVALALVREIGAVHGTGWRSRAA